MRFSPAYVVPPKRKSKQITINLDNEEPAFEKSDDGNQ